MKNEWQPIETAPNGDATPFVFLLLGEFIPDVPCVQAGKFCTADECAELGYYEHTDGGWLIFSQDSSDFCVVGIEEPLAWMPLPPPPGSTE